MPKWLLVFVFSAIAGLIGFACGSLLTRTDRQAAEHALADVRQSARETTDDCNRLLREAQLQMNDKMNQINKLEREKHEQAIDRNK